MPMSVTSAKRYCRRLGRLHGGGAAVRAVSQCAFDTAGRRTAVDTGRRLGWLYHHLNYRRDMRAAVVLTPRSENRTVRSVGQTRSLMPFDDLVQNEIGKPWKSRSFLPTGIDRASVK